MRVVKTFVTLVVLVFVLVIPSQGDGALAAHEEIGVRFKDELSNGLQLTVYYIPLDTQTRFPYRDVDVVSHHVYKIVVNSSGLLSHFDSLQKLGEIKTSSVDAGRRLDLRVYAELTSRRGKLITFGLEGDSRLMLLDGRVVKSRIAFYEALLPHLPYSEIESFAGSMKGVSRY